MDYKIIVSFIGFLFVFSFFCGCSEQNTAPLGHDSRFIGRWQNQQQIFDAVEFYSDGTYLVEEGEMGNWSTQAGGTLWMSGTSYAYEFSENGTILSLTKDSNTRFFLKQ